MTPVCLSRETRPRNWLTNALFPIFMSIFNISHNDQKPNADHIACLPNIHESTFGEQLDE
jgi:hypothetical protein